MILINIILFILYVSVSQSRVPDKVLCVNIECSEPISKAKTLISYNAGDADLISHPANADAYIFMKSAGTNADLWYATINGKSGFVNSKFLREYKILYKNPQVLVSFEKPLKESSNVRPDKIQQAHEVIDGTKIYTTEPVVLNPTTEMPITQSPSTEIPITKLSSTEIPITQSPSTEIPITQSPSTEIPITQSPSTEIPITQSPSTEIPITQSPSTEIPIAQSPSTEIPIAQSPSTEIPVNVNLNPNILHPYIDINKLSDASDSAETQKKYLLETNNNDNNNLQSEVTQPYIRNHDTVTHYSSSENTEPINIDAKSEYESNINQNFNPELLVHNVLNLTTKNVYDNHDQIQNISADAQPEGTGDINMSVEHSIINDGIEKLKIEDTITKNDQITHEENSVNKGDIKTEQVTLNLDTNEVEASSVYVSTKNIEPILNQQINEIANNGLKTNNVNMVENLQPIKTNTEAVLDDKDLNESFDVDSVIVDNINQNNNIASIKTEYEQASPLTDNVPTNPLEYPNNNVNTINEMDNAIPDSSSTIAAVFNTEVPKVDTAYEQDNLISVDNVKENSAEIHREAVVNDEYTKSQETNTIVTSANNILSHSTESSSIEDKSIITTPEPLFEINDVKEEPEDKKSESILSSMYTTISDIWPSTTETPKHIYNSKDYPPYEKTKVDGEESFSIVKFIMSTYSSVMGIDDQTKAIIGSAGETYFTNEYCDGTSNERNNRLLTFLLTTACSVLLFTLGYYYIDIKRQDGRLIGTINSLQRDLLFTTKECEILKEELATTKTKLAGIEDSSFGMDDMVQSLKEEINELKAQNERLRNSLDANEKLLRVSENTAGELQNTLSDVENTLSELFAERAYSEEQITELNEKVQAFEEELISVSRERDNFQLKYVSAETSLEEANKQIKQLDEINKQLADAKNTNELQKHEIMALKDALKDLKSNSSSNVDITSLIDHTEIKAKLAKALEERNSYAGKYEVEYKERLRLTEQHKTTQDNLRTSSQQAAEAMTRLEVLGKYFQERESELMKELNSKESLWLSKQGESASTVDKIELLQQEVQRYKEKCDALTLELAEQESTRRTTVSEVDARAHAAWLEARAAKREADAARDEAATLRRKLASLSTADGAISPHHKISSPLDNSENQVIPPPLPPLAFLPPPLLPPLPRPPPLGRLPSPHPPRYNDRRYSPDSRYSPGSRYSPESRYSPDTVRYSPRQRPTSYSPRSRRRSRERYQEGRNSRSRNVPDTETEYPSDSPSRDPRRRNRYARHSGPSSGSGCSSESDK